MGTALPPRGPAQPPGNHVPLFLGADLSDPSPQHFSWKTPRVVIYPLSTELCGQGPLQLWSLPVSHTVPCGFLLYDRDRPRLTGPREEQKGPAGPHGAQGTRLSPRTEELSFICP